MPTTKEKESVLITGGAGSVGREFVRLLKDDYKVTVVDSNEWAVAELQQEFPDVRVKLADFSSLSGVRTNYILHLAAYKHVNLGETNIADFVENNVSKTIEFYKKAKCNRLLYLSTDKAVEPISAYGATKMLAERLTWSVGGQVARCGNFLHSSGSVIPVWEKAIKDSQPIPITDEKMTRYVCKMDEAVKEIWERFLKGERLIIPKSDHVKLLDLLNDVLKKHNLTIKKYKPGIKTIGIRPGEKMTEKLKWSWE